MVLWTRGQRVRRRHCSLSLPTVDPKSHVPHPRRQQKNDENKSLLHGAQVGNAGDAVSVSDAGIAGAFLNPHGYVLDVVTLRQAVEVETQGQHTAEHSWFPGYAWALAFCSSCGQHLVSLLQGGFLLCSGGLKSCKVVEVRKRMAAWGGTRSSTPGSPDA